MSVKAKLEVFDLKIREKGNKKEYLNWNDVAGFNLLNEISLYLNKNIYLFKIDREAERTSRIEKNELLDNKLFCRIKVGKFGESSELVDTVSGSGVFHKEPEHSDTIPLFFSIITNENGDTTTLIIERSGNRTLLPFIRPMLTIVLNSLREDLFTYRIIARKENTSLKKILTESPNALKSVEMTISDKNSDDIMEAPKMVLKPKNRKTFPDKVISSLVSENRKKTVNSLKGLLPVILKQSEIDDIKLVLRMADGQKTKIDLGSSLELSNRLLLDTTEKDLDKFGHPSYKFLKNYCIGL